MSNKGEVMEIVGYDEVGGKRYPRYAGPCRGCGEVNYSASTSGPDYCPACACGVHPEVTRAKRKTMEQYKEISELKAKLDEVSHILQSEWKEIVRCRKGSEEITVNNDAYYELEAVLQDIRHDEGYCDNMCISTLRDVQIRIAEVMKIVDEYRTERNTKS